MAYTHIYECPEGCKSQGGKPIAATIRGWKKHMTHNHRGYSEEQLSVILGMTPNNPESGRAQFLSEDESTSESVLTTDSLKPDAEGEQQRTTSLKTDAVARKFSGRMNKFKKSVADKVPKVLASAIKEKGPEWQLTEEDAEMLSEAVENCFEVLDVDFQIAPISKTLTNPLWVLALPFFTLILIFIPKAIKNAANKPAEEHSNAPVATE